MRLESSVSLRSTATEAGPGGAGPGGGEAPSEEAPPTEPAPEKRRYGHRSPAEKAEAARIKQERRDLKKKELDVLASLVPAMESEGEPPALDPWKSLLKVDKKVVLAGTLLMMPRATAYSELRVAHKYYDGQNGSMPLENYAHLCVFYTHGNGFRYRTRGTIIEPGELRPVSKVLSDLADTLGIAPLSNGSTDPTPSTE